MSLFPPRFRVEPAGLFLLLLPGVLAPESPGQLMGQVPQRYPGAIVGRVIDMQSGEGIVNATVRLLDVDQAASTLTNPEGQFRLWEVQAGVHEIEVSHIAYGRTAHLVNVPEGVTVELEIRLGFSPIMLDSLVAEVEVRPAALLRAGFYERMRLGRGHFFHGEDTERWRPEQLLRLVPGIQDVQGAVRLPFEQRYAFKVTAGFGGTCYPEVFLDGVRFRGLEGDLREVAGGVHIAAMEVYRRFDTPAEFQTTQNPPCGAIVMWSQRE